MIKSTATMPNVTVPALPPFGGVTPVLRVRDVVASRDHHVHALGFQLSFEKEDFASVPIAVPASPTENGSICTAAAG